MAKNSFVAEVTFNSVREFVPNSIISIRRKLKKIFKLKVLKWLRLQKQMMQVSVVHNFY